MSSKPLSSKMLSPKTLTIWVYQDEGVSELSARSVLNKMADKLSAQGASVEAVRPISRQQIINGALKGRGCLVMPGGADLPYCAKLNGIGNQMIKQYIHQGNLYIGICAGAYYGARSLDFMGDGYEVQGDRELAFFPGRAIGCIPSLTEGRRYDMGCASKSIVPLDFADGQQHHLYYHGGPYFVDSKDLTTTATASSASTPLLNLTQAPSRQPYPPYDVIAYYPDGSKAIISGQYGKGGYFLSGVHFELCPAMYTTLEVEQTSPMHLGKEHRLLTHISDTHYAQPVYQYLAGLIKDVIE